MKRLTVLAAFLAIVPAQAEEDIQAYETGNELYRICSSVDQGLIGECLGYVLGSVDMIYMMASAKGGHGPCIPKNVNARQIQDIVVKHLRDTPAERHTIAASNIIIAVTDAFPCPAK